MSLYKICIEMQHKKDHNKNESLHTLTRLQHIHMLSEY